ncbi:MAG TPA: hypothetical protein VFY32_07600 [Solirubrobacteraceae bacterium]|nr:hypothetical protein [Solirubrobacteraceae bacterium]
MPLAVVALGELATGRDQATAGYFVETVIGDDLACAELAIGLGADVLVVAASADVVCIGWGTPDERAVTRTSTAWLRTQSFASDSMTSKVEAVCRFVEATGKRGAIGRLEDIRRLLDGTAGTQIGVDHAVELALLHQEEDRNLFAMRKAQDQLDAGERELTSKLRELGESAARAQVSIEREWRREHGGHDPERPPAWRRHQ